MSAFELKAEKNDFISRLARTVSLLFDLSNDATLISKDGLSEQEWRTKLFALQDKVSKKAKELKADLDILIIRDFSKRTEEFEAAYTELKKVDDEIQTEISKLEKLVRSFENFNKFLQLVDQAIVIAAGLAKSV